jgi:malonyl-CoA O-methyltransferase
MERDDYPRLEPRVLQRAFDRASAAYDQHAVLHAAVRTELLARLELLDFEPRVVVDLGTGTGHAARALRERWRAARVLALDFAPGMLREAARRQSWRRRFDCIRADAARLPLANGSVDLVFSNLMLHWAVDLDAVLAELRRVLAPRGCVTFSTVGPDTLKELRAAWGEVDARPHVGRFLDLHDVGDALVRAGFADPVMDVDRYTLTYASLPALLAELKGVGSRNALAGRAPGLTSRSRRARLEAAYERFRTGDGRLPASCEIVYGQAWCPGATPPIRSRRGETVVPLGSITHRR